jgi:hypothetical protein
LFPDFDGLGGGEHHGASDAAPYLADIDPGANARDDGGRLGAASEDASVPNSWDATSPTDGGSLDVISDGDDDAGSVDTGMGDEAIGIQGADDGGLGTTCLPNAVVIAATPRRASNAMSLAGTGDTPWKQTTAALLLDGMSALSSLFDNKTEELLIADFGYSLPSSAVAITGVEVTVTRKSDDGQTNDKAVRLYLGGFPIGTAKRGGGWPKSPTAATYGSNSDLWGTSLTPGQVAQSDFGVSIQAATTGIDNARIDDVYVTIHYCE